MNFKKSHCQSRCGLATLRWLILITLQGCKYAKRNTRFFNIKICLNLSKTRERYVYFIDHFFKWKNAKSRQTYSGWYLTSVHPHYLFCISDCMKFYSLHFPECILLHILFTLVFKYIYPLHISFEIRPVYYLAWDDILIAIKKFGAVKILFPDITMQLNISSIVFLRLDITL